MRKTILVVMVSGVVLVPLGAMAASTAGATQSLAPAAPHAETSSAMPAAVAAARFGFDLFAHLRQARGNVFFSPLSIEMALAMASEGASGETARQMRSTLHLPVGTPLDFAALRRQLSPVDSTYDLAIANAIWGDRRTNFSREYVERLKHGYGAELNQVDFADPARASATINAWVSTRTHDRIRELITAGAIRPQTRLVLANAIYFKSRWADAFDESMTREDDFTPLHAPKERVPFMQLSRKVRYAENRLTQMLELPYAGTGLSMLVILPRRAADMDAVEKELSFDGVKGWLASLHSRPVEVHLPRFSLEEHYALDEVLPAMGMSDAFDSRRADFSGMDGGRDLSIGLVAHKAFIEVNEKGTTAAAATGVMMPTSLIRPDSEVPVVFRADHPFLFLIRDSRSGAVAFMGRFSQPAP
jgi:serpin B